MKYSNHLSMGAAMSVAAFMALAGASSVAAATDAPAKPHQILARLADRMYVTGETGALPDNFAATEQAAAAEIRAYVGNGDATALVERNSAGQTPLMIAAFAGWPHVIEELLKADAVKAGIDDESKLGLSAWMYASLAYKQTLWACNPKAFESPFAFVPLLVQQSYYRLTPDNPYRRSRQLLQAAGAMADVDRAKRFWQDNCKQQTEHTRLKIQESADLLEAVIEEGNAAIDAFVASQRAKTK